MIPHGCDLPPIGRWARRSLGRVRGQERCKGAARIAVGQQPQVLDRVISLRARSRGPGGPSERTVPDQYANVDGGADTCADRTVHGPSKPVPTTRPSRSRPRASSRSRRRERCNACPQRRMAVAVTPTSFLAAVWGGLHTLTSDRGGRFHTVHIFDNPEALLDAAFDENRHGANVWFGAHPLAQRPLKGRGGNEDVAVMRALVADLDWHDPHQPAAHKDGADLPTEAQVRATIGELTVAPPTIVVNSGHGLQTWWLLGTPVDVATGHDLTIRLHAEIERLGIPTDRDDPASVLRLPGTISYKPDCAPVEVAVETVHLDRRHQPEYLAKHLRPAPARSRRSSGKGNGGVSDRGLNDVTTKLRTDGRHQDADALTVLCGSRYGGHDPYLTRAGHIEVTRPGKQAGTSATIGYVAPGVVKMMSSSWDLNGFKFRRHDRYTLADDGITFESTSGDRDDHGNGQGGGGSDTKRRSARDVLVDLAVEHYRIGRTEDERPFLVPHDGANVALFAGAAKADLARRYRAATGSTIGRTPLDEAWIDRRRARARRTKDGASATRRRVSRRTRHRPRRRHRPRHRRHTRRVDVANRSPVTFRRSKAMLPLPEPQPGGTSTSCSTYCASRRAAATCSPPGSCPPCSNELPHPAPVFRGEQGAAKSTTARLDVAARSTHAPPTHRSRPRPTTNGRTACSARWIVAVDNVSTVPEWWSDALCRTITGDGWLRRALYTDDDVVVTKWRRCVILNGISLGATLRPDLAERLVFFDLERPEQYLTEAEVDARLDAIAPRVLGALLDRAVHTLAALPTHRARPRSPDGRLRPPARRLRPRQRHDRTRRLPHRARRSVRRGAGRRPARHSRRRLHGTPSRLGRNTGRTLRSLAQHRPAGEGFWPKSAHHLSTVMSRSASSLRRAGIVWTRLPRTATGRSVRLARRVDGALTPDDAVTPNDADDADSLFVVFEGEEEENGSEGQQAQQERNQRHDRHSASQRHYSGPCPICGTDGYHVASGTCRTKQCVGF